MRSAVLGSRAECPDLVVECRTYVQEVVGSRLGRVTTHGCTYQHTPTLILLEGVLVGVLTSTLLLLYLSGMFLWVYLPAYFSPSQGCFHGCTYQHTPALVPLGCVCLCVGGWVYLPAYFCPCTFQGCSRTLRDTRAAHVTHHTETHTAALNIDW